MGHLNNYLLKDLTWPKYLKRDRTLVIDISSNIIWARKQQRNRMRTATQQERTHPHIGGSIKSDETSRPYSCSIFCAALARSPQVSLLSSNWHQCHAVLLLPSTRSYPYTRKHVDLGHGHRRNIKLDINVWRMALQYFSLLILRKKGYR